MDKVRAAAVQATPVFLHRDETVEKAVRLIEEAAAEGAGLIVFPETFIPTYPDWVWRAGGGDRPAPPPDAPPLGEAPEGAPPPPPGPGEGAPPAPAPAANGTHPR